MTVVSESACVNQRRYGVLDFGCGAVTARLETLLEYRGEFVGITRLDERLFR